MCQPSGSDPAEHSQHEQALLQLIDDHFRLALERVEPVYQQHFARPATVAARHWRHRRDIPQDLLLLPRSLGRVILRRPAGEMPTGKQQELRRILEQELLDLPGLEQTLQHYCEHVIAGYGEQLDRQPLTGPQRQQFEAYVDHQLQRLHLPGEGVREGLLALTIMLTGRLLGDKALLSSAASLGSTLAGSVYIGQQSWWGAFWAGWFGVPGWVSWAGIGTGVASLLIISPLLAPGVEWGMNRLRARRLLTRTVLQARDQLRDKDHLLMVSRLGLYLQLLPDLAQYLARLKAG